ncbi:MAG: YggW family oxidoreductase [SAR86 cluster bacterium]|uniref:Heme chaperone HemW n=1 Tax=SAR86 cluster bacterium TaxID=2030880 RepID=A0A2A4MQL5_9GAMM|nr:MAG: YggW family oxidoreductase [SAR86 cluster bacterium]
MLELPPLSLYIHIPWCEKKCPYCDFNSHQSASVIPEQDYVQALIQDFAEESHLLQGRAIETIFIGGGTPSLFSASAYEQLFEALQKTAHFSSDIEITLEANPGSAEANKFKAYRSAGINRLSIGVQSFNDAQLQKLGRIHSADEALRAIESANAAGFDNFNLDLMYGLPQQSAAAAMDDLASAIRCQPQHLSWYQLTIEPNTVFYSKPPKLPKEEPLHQIQEMGLALMQQHGYHRYEVSAFAKHGSQCRHNLNYWGFGDYIGIGAGAHGKLSVVAEDRIYRKRKIKQPDHYLRNQLNRCAEVVEVEHEDRLLEFLMNGLRLKQGFSITSLETRTGIAFREIEKQVESLIQQDLLVRREDTLAATDKGYLFIDSVLQKFL